MRLRLIRHATLAMEYHGHQLLVDPMLDEAEARGPIQNSPNSRKNPLVPLPMPAAKIVDDVEAVIVTHTHSDHWDGTAAQLIRKNIPLFAQPEDEDKIRQQGFSNVQPLRPPQPPHSCVSAPWQLVESVPVQLLVTGSQLRMRQPCTWIRPSAWSALSTAVVV